MPVETLEQQAARAYKQVCRLDDDAGKYIYTRDHDRNEVLCYDYRSPCVPKLPLASVR